MRLFLGARHGSESDQRAPCNVQQYSIQCHTASEPEHTTYNAQGWPKRTALGLAPSAANRSFMACTRAEAAQTRRDTTAFGRIGVSLSVSDPSIPVDRQVLERETDRLDELLQRKNDEIRLLKARCPHARPHAPPLSPSHACARARSQRTHACDAGRFPLEARWCGRRPSKRASSSSRRRNGSSNPCAPTGEGRSERGMEGFEQGRVAGKGAYVSVEAVHLRTVSA